MLLAHEKGHQDDNPALPHETPLPQKAVFALQCQPLLCLASLPPPLLF